MKRCRNQMGNKCLKSGKEINDLQTSYRSRILSIQISKLDYKMFKVAIQKSEKTKNKQKKLPLNCIGSSFKNVQRGTWSTAS